MSDVSALIVFEGLDGAGTSTQVQKLRDYLTSKDLAVEVTREPTNGPFGKELRLIIDERVKVDPVSTALAFAADRSDHLFNPQNGIEKALSSGRVVICDRYVLSNIAYQSEDIQAYLARTNGAANKQDAYDWLRAINRFVRAPDLTIFVQTPVETCTERINLRSSHAELFHTEDRLRKVEQAFLDVIRFEDLVGKLVVADGLQSPDDVFQSFIGEVDRLLGRERALRSG